MKNRNIVDILYSHIIIIGLCVVLIIINSELFEKDKIISNLENEIKYQKILIESYTDVGFGAGD